MSKKELMDIVFYEQKQLEIFVDEIERLNNIINGLNNAYCKVITKCEEMINSRFLYEWLCY